MSNVINIGQARGERAGKRPAAATTSEQTESPTAPSVPAEVAKMLAPLDAALAQLKASTEKLIASTQALKAAREREIAARRGLIVFARKGSPPETPT